MSSYAMLWIPSFLTNPLGILMKFGVKEPRPYTLSPVHSGIWPSHGPHCLVWPRLRHPEWVIPDEQSHFLNNLSPKLISIWE